MESKVCELDDTLIQCTFTLGCTTLGTYWMNSKDVYLGNTFRYESPLIKGEREKTALRILGVQQVLQNDSFLYFVKVEAVELLVLPPGW